MRHAPAADPQAVARLLSAIADVEAHEGRRPVAAADIDLVNVLTAFPDSVLPLPAAVALSASPEDYLTAAAQSALLETFGGGAVAAAAQALAEDMRHALDYAVPESPPEAPERPSPAPSRRRRGCRAAAQLPVPTGTVDADEGSTQARPAGISEAAWDTFDAVDLKEELRHPVPTLQDVPPFMRTAVRAALTTALKGYAVPAS